MPEPFAASRGGCGGYQTTATTQPDHCGNPVAWAGLVYFPYPIPELWWAFACDQHREQLQAARPLNDRDRAELEQRRAAWDLARRGEGPWRPPRPLRTGPEAHAFLARVTST